MNSRSKVAAAVAGGVLLIWFVTFVVEWHIRTGWQQHWADAAFRAWGNFAMMGWVADYQTLISAVLALAGLAVVYLQRHWQTEAEKTRDHREAMHALDWTMIALKSVGELARGGRPNAAMNELASLRATLPNLARISPGLADNMRIAIDTLSAYLGAFSNDLIILTDQSGDEVEVHPDEYIFMMATLWAGFFENSARLFDQELRFRFVRQAPEVAKRWLDGLNFDHRMFPYMSGFYD